MPSVEDQQRAVVFLEGKKPGQHSPYPEIYRALLRSIAPMTSQQICDVMGGGTNSNNVSSKLNRMRRCGLVEVTGETRSDTTGRMVSLWRVIEAVPAVIEFHPPQSWYLAIDVLGGVVDTIRTTRTTRGEMNAKNPGCQVLRAVEADSE